MFGKRSTLVAKQTLDVPIKKLEYQPDVDSALGMFRLLKLSSPVTDEDLILAEKVQDIDNMHIRTDYIIHPRSAIRKTDNGRFSVEAIKAERLDNLTNLYFNPAWAKDLLGEVPKRFLTQDGWELFTLKGEEMLEVNSAPYKKCSDCHETMPNYWRLEGHSKPGIDRFHPLAFQETRTYKLKTPLQSLLKNTGMVITRIDHPCYHSLQQLLRPETTLSVDPPSLEPVFPKDISF